MPSRSISSRSYAPSDAASDGRPTEDRPRRRGLLAYGWAPYIVAFGVTLAGVLLYRTLSGYSVDELVASVTAVPTARLAGAAGFAAASYVCLTGFDYLALRSIGRPLRYPRVALASFTSLSIGHNIGVAALSSGAVRYRFYSRWGLSAGDVARVIVFCGITVGLGLATLGGLAMLLQPSLASEITGLGRIPVVLLGVLCLSAPAAYLVVAAFVRRPIGFRRFTLEAPALPLAVGQIAVGTANFACVAGCLHQALAAVADAAYLQTAAVYVIANATALVSHVPGGLGVIESVVMVLHPGQDLIGPLLVFRFVYFLAPLVLGGLLFAGSEAVFRWRDRSAAGEAARAG